MQRDTTLRSHVHLSIAVSLFVTYLLAMLNDQFGSSKWMHRSTVGAAIVILLFIAQESLGHVAYLRFGTDARDKVTAWLDQNVPADRIVAVTPYYHGDWGTIPPLDERRRKVELLPLSRNYDASGYVSRKLDYVIVSDLMMEAPEISTDARAFLAILQNNRDYRLVAAFKPSFEAIHPAEWLGWIAHADWRYTRPTFYIYERRRTASPGLSIY